MSSEVQRKSGFRRAGSGSGDCRCVAGPAGTAAASLQEALEALCESGARVERAEPGGSRTIPSPASARPTAPCDGEGEVGEYRALLRACEDLRDRHAVPAGLKSLCDAWEDADASGEPTPPSVRVAV